MAEPVKETLFFAFIHGFQGGEDTFGDLPQTLKENLSSLDLVMKHFVFKSQGDLIQCVATFRKWHKEQVDAIEEMKQINVPTVRTILICHSMGGIIAADSLLAMVTDNDPIHSSILGLIAYDTPYLGLNPPVIHRTISTRVQTITSAINTAREWIPSSLFPSSNPSNKQLTLASSSSPLPATKKSWGWATKLAAVSAGVAAVGALSYYAKDPIVNHLQFVSVLYKPDDLAKRMTRLCAAVEGKSGFVVFYTVVTHPGEEEGQEGERTFCLLPQRGQEVAEGGAGRWIRQENGLAKDEVEAHCTMFLKAYNDHYEELCRQSLGLIREWIGVGR